MHSPTPRASHYLLLPSPPYPQCHPILGLQVHADAAMVNLNIWLAPDSANLGSAKAGDGGGLTIFHAKPPGMDHDVMSASQQRCMTVVERKR